MRPKEREGQSKRPLKQAWAQASFPPQLSQLWSQPCRVEQLGPELVSGDPGAEPWAAGAACCDFSKACGRRHSRWPRLQSTPGSQGRTQKTKFRCAGASWQMHREVLHHSLQAGPGPCALLAMARLCFVCPVYVSREGICKTSSSVRAVQLCGAEADRPGRGRLVRSGSACQPLPRTCLGAPHSAGAPT